MCLYYVVICFYCIVFLKIAKQNLFLITLSFLSVCIQLDATYA